MGFLERLEIGVLFRVTRAFSVCVILVLIVLLLLSLYDAIGTFGGAQIYPDIEEVFARLAPQRYEPAAPETNPTQGPDLSSLKLPFSVQRYFSEPDSRSRLVEQVFRLPPEQRDGYVRQLAAVIDEAEKRNSGVGSAVSVYMQLVDERLQLIQSSKEALKAKQLQSVEAAIAILMLIALFSLILVLLAIERNTRSSRVA
ncbi:MAG: hypothetical protein ABSG11_24400 [Candidatus Korobacteraceae bacterium]|jgi:hypothetical protein